MFYSQCLLSKKGPLGAIWAAAYFFKKLKKAQVKETDIPSSVDEILQNEWDAVAYRFLAYLLVGVVRIYSKKVDYLFDDCNKVLIRVNDFVVKEKGRAQKKESFAVPCLSIVLPERFELDAFDLDILEDVTGENIRPLEEITLRDDATNSEGMGHYSLEKFDIEEFAPCHEDCATDHDRTESVHFSHETEIPSEIRTSRSVDLMDIDTEDVRAKEVAEEYVIMGLGTEPLDPNKSPGKDHQNSEEYTHLGSYRMEEPSREKLRDDEFHQGECMSLDTNHRADHESPSHGVTATQNRGTVREEMNVSDHVEPMNGMNDPKEDQGSAEKLRGDRFSEAGRIDFEMFAGHEEEALEVPVTVYKENHTGLQPKVVSLEIEKSPGSAAATPVLVTPDVTPHLRLPRDSGASTMPFKFISTPAAKEGAPALKKRKCLIDDTVVLSNGYMRRCLEDSSELITRRKKVAFTTLAAWRMHRLSSISHCFLDPLISYSSLEIQSLFSKKKMKLSETCRPSKPLKRADMEETSVGTKPSEQAEIAPDTLVRESVSARKPSEQEEIAPETPVRESASARKALEQEEIAPETPVRESASVRPFKSPESPVVDRARPKNSFETLEEVPSPIKDHDLELDQICGSEGGESQLNEWSWRARMVVGYWEKKFLHQSKKGDGEIVNLLQLCEGRTRKESARLFYEILVLKTKGYVDVKQEDAYGDILVLKAS